MDECNNNNIWKQQNTSDTDALKTRILALSKNGRHKYTVVHLKIPKILRGIYWKGEATEMTEEVIAHLKETNGSSIFPLLSGEALWDKKLAL